MTFGERVRARRQELNITCEELALRAGYGHRQSLGLIERDERLPTRTRLRGLAEALDLPVGDVLCWMPDGAPVRQREGRHVRNKQLRNLLYRADMSVQDLCFKIGLSASNLSHHATHPEGWSESVARKVAAALGCDLTDLGPIRHHARGQAKKPKDEKPGGCRPETAAAIASLARKDPDGFYGRLSMLMRGHSRQVAGGCA